MIEIEEMRISHPRNQVLRTLDYHQRYSDGKDENPSDFRLAQTKKHQRGSTVCQTDKLLLQVLERIFNNHGTAIQIAQERLQV